MCYIKIKYSMVLALKGRMLAMNAVLEDRAYRELKERILDGRYPAGMVLSENSIASELGMSRTPVRSTISRLCMEGFVLQKKGHFSTVRLVTPEDISNFFQFSLAMEEFALRTLFQKGIEQLNLEKMKQNIQQQIKAVEQGSAHSYSRYDHVFHMELISTLQNSEISKAMDNIWEKIQMVISPRGLNVHRPVGKDSIPEHILIVQAFETGCSLDEILDLFKSHNINARNRVLMR